MDSALSGAIAGGVVGGVLLVIVTAMVCYICFKQMHKDYEEKPNPRAPVMNGHVPNGAIPTVGQLVPYKPGTQPFTLRNHYQYTTMPVRQNITSYRPRYIEERNPVGEVTEVRPEPQTFVTTKSNTYNGPYASHANGMVVYDVTRHKDIRSDRRPLWAQKSQEEAIATMVLDEEDSPRSSANILKEENNNNSGSVKRDTEFTIVDYVPTKRLPRPEEIVVPSPDAKRKEYLLVAEDDDESSHPSGQRSSSSANDRSHHSSWAEQEPANQRRRESRRQRRGVEGVPTPPKVRSDPKLLPVEQDSAVYVRSLPQPIPAGYVPYVAPYPVAHVMVPDESLYAVSSKAKKPSHDARHSGSNFVRPVSYGAPEVNPSSVNPVDDLYDHINRPKMDWQHQNNHIQDGGSQPIVWRPELEELEMRDQHREMHPDYRVIKSNRRPSWLQNAGSWFKRGSSKK